MLLKFNFHQNATDLDKQAIYKNLFGLKPLTADDSFIKKISYYLSRCWIHLTGGQVDKQAFSTLDSLNERQQALILSTLKSNPNWSHYHAEYVHYFSEKIEIDLKEDSSNIIRQVMEIGNAALFKQLLLIYPFDITHDIKKNWQAALKSGNEETVQALIKLFEGPTFPFSEQRDSILKDAIILNPHNADKNILQLINSKKISKPELLEFLYYSKALQNLTPQTYIEIINEAQFDERTLMSLIQFICREKHIEIFNGFLSSLEQTSSGKNVAELLEKCLKDCQFSIEKAEQAYRQTDPMYFAMSQNNRYIQLQNAKDLKAWLIDHTPAHLKTKSFSTI